MLLRRSRNGGHSNPGGRTAQKGPADDRRSPVYPRYPGVPEGAQGWELLTVAILTLVAYRFMVGGLVLNASRLTRLMEIEHAPGVEQPGHIRPNVGMHDQRLQAGLKRPQVARLGGGVEQLLNPLLCAMGGLLLLGHMHARFQLKKEFLIQMTHNAIGLLAVIIACGRWLELRLTPRAGRLDGAVFMSALLVVGFILLFYRETLVSSG
jgi:hypothetical protein